MDATIMDHKINFEFGLAMDAAFCRPIYKFTTQHCHICYAVNILIT